ncbi:MAG: hydroxymethylglutaryl-CoA lyase [Planctomycetota bacterium]|jgi:hydroxymethylglutaryl-CoA lyase|nr:hydroxymethylglutaryl-CoA lyase [Planctomycetota bacterium]
MKIHEVAARDGLQNESAILSVEQKMRLLDLLAATKPDSLEITSFVRADRVPQFADAAEVCERLRDAEWRNEIPCVGLVINMRGYESFSNSGLDAITAVIGANQQFSKDNSGMSVERALQVNEELVAAAHADGFPVRMYLSMAFGSPSSAVEKNLVSELVAASAEMNVDRIVLSDTVGVATPQLTQEIIANAMRYCDVSQLGMHMHDTYGRALSNCEAGIDLGVEYFDASAGGTGGCPFAPGASGNLATGALLGLAQRRQCAPQAMTLDAIDSATEFLSCALNKELARGVKLRP